MTPGAGAGRVARYFIATVLLVGATVLATRPSDAAGSLGLLDWLFPTTTQPAPAAPTTAAPTTTAGPTTTAAPTTTIKTETPPTGAVNPTGLTHLRFTIDNSAQWSVLTMKNVNVIKAQVTSTTGSFYFGSYGGPEISVGGNGRGVLDVVMSIAPGAATSMSMCKNWMGPTSVTITRVNDSPANIASFTNSGSSWYVPAGSCENAMSIAISRASMLGAARWPARRDSRPLVLANYYPWYDASPIVNWDTPTSAGDTSSAASVAAAVNMAATNGIDAFLVEYDTNPVYEPRVDLVYNAANQRSGFKVAMAIDAAMINYHFGGLTGEKMDQVLQSVANRSSNLSQLKVGERPVVFLYYASQVDAYQWSAALARLQQSRGISPFVIADDQSHNASGFVHYSNISASNDLQRWANDSLYLNRVTPGINSQPSTFWVAPVSPGYDDRGSGRSSTKVVDRGGGYWYDWSWQMALATYPEWVLITSWNEYYENTHVIPGTYTGTKALDQTRTWSAQFHTTG